MSGITQQSTVQGDPSSLVLFPQQPLAYEQPHETSGVRAVAQIQGVNYAVSRLSIEMNAHGATDAADFSLPLSSSPDFTSLISRGANNTSQVPVSIYVGVFQSPPTTANNSIVGLTEIFAGQVDVYSLVFDEDEITFHCRSLAAALVDNRITAIPRNMTTTQFVQNVAAQYGLTAQVMLPPGQYPFTVAEIYQHDFAVGIQNDRIWDALIKFANWDDVDVWVSGSTLYYASPSLVQRQTIDLKYGRDIEKLTVQHSPLFSKSIRVEVRTYNPKTRVSTIQRVSTNALGGVNVVSSSRTVTSTPEFGTQSLSTQSISSTGAVTQTTSTASGGGFNSTAEQGANESSVERYIIYKPGISPQAANQLAQSTWRRLSMQEYTATIVIPLWRSKFPNIAITSLIRLHGMPMQIPNSVSPSTMYYPRRISWEISADAGAMVTIEATNHMPPAGAV